MVGSMKGGPLRSFLLACVLLALFVLADSTLNLVLDSTRTMNQDGEIIGPQWSLRWVYVQHALQILHVREPQSLINPIKSIQRGCITATNTATVTAINGASTVVYSTGPSDGATGDLAHEGVKFGITSTTVITGSATTGGNSACFELVEYNPFFVKSIQDFDISLNGVSSNTATITSVSTTRSTAINRGFLGTGTGGTRGDEGYKMTLTNGTTVTATRAGTSAMNYPTVAGTVLEFR